MVVDKVRAEISSWIILLLVYRDQAGSSPGLISRWFIGFRAGQSWPNILLVYCVLAGLGSRINFLLVYQLPAWTVFLAIFLLFYMVRAGLVPVTINSWF